MKDEIQRVLTMMEEGKIDAEKAAELIELLNEKKESSTNVTYRENLDKMLRVKVLSANDDKVNINVPVRFLKAIGSAVNSINIPHVSDQEGIDIKMIMEAIDSGLDGKLVDIKSSDGDFVEISIE